MAGFDVAQVLSRHEKNPAVSGYVWYGWYGMYCMYG